MSPIPSVTEAFSLPSLAPSVISNPVSGGQSASMSSVHLLGTGGFLFAVVAIISVAGYFYHSRSSGNGARSSNTWASFTNMLSGIRHRGTDRYTTKAATAASPRDPEIGLEHVNMVYANFFHPAFWDVVECHPGTPSTPTIFVEDEAKEDPAPRPAPPGMHSFLDMDDESAENGDRDTENAREKPGKSVRECSKVRVPSIPPYDTTSGTNVNFSSAIIGTTVRLGTFLSVPGAHEYDEPEPIDDASHEDSSESLDTEPEFDHDCSPYDGVIIIGDRDRPLPPLPLNARRYGMADMSNLALSLQDAIPVDGYGLVPTFSRRVGLVDATESDGTHVNVSYHLEKKDNWSTTVECDIGCCTGYPRRGPMDPTVFWDPVNHFESVDDDSEDVTNVDRHLGDHVSCDGLQTVVSTTNTDIAVRKDSVAGTEHDIGAYNTCDGLWSSGNSTDIGVYEETYGSATHFDISAYGGCDGLRASGSATDTDGVTQEPMAGTITDLNDDVCYGLRSDGSTTNDSFHEGLYLMEQLLSELRDPYLECNPRDLSEDSDFESGYGDSDDDDDDDDEQAKRKSVGSAPPKDDIREVPVLHPTLPLKIVKSRATAPVVRKGHKRSPALKWINNEAEITPAIPSECSPFFQVDVNLKCDPHIQEEIYHYVRG